MELLTRERLRIVHVEDDYDFASLSERYLKRAGFKRPIVHCDDGLPAVRYLSQIEPEKAPHVLLIDFHMPRMNGLEVAAWLRQNHTGGDIAVYILSSSEDPQHRRRATEIGVTEFLLKSHPFEKLFQVLDQLIETSNRRRRLEKQDGTA